MGPVPAALAALVALAIATTSTPPPPFHESTHSIPPPNRSVLLGLLHSLGFSDNCVATALDTCGAVPQECQLATLLKETRGLLQETRDLRQNAAHIGDKTRIQPRHCKALQDAADVQSGVRVIHPYPGDPERRLSVYCDQTTDGGGWLVFQRRTNSSIREDFYKNIQEYREGFGNLEEEFWLGLDALHVLTFTEPQELRIDLADWEGGYEWAKYDSFRVDGPTKKYRLTVGGYSGTAGDGLAIHSGQKFSTHDSDNDDLDGHNCAEWHRGAWWYKNCHTSNLNGYQYETNPSDVTKGINWSTTQGNNSYSLRRTTMMIRPVKRSC